MAYSDIILADAPVGYWPLNETAGTTAADQSGNAYHFTIGGGVTPGGSGGPLGNYFTFNGVDGRLQRAGTAALRVATGGAGKFTFEGWIYPDSTNTHNSANLWNPRENMNVRARISMPAGNPWLLVYDGANFQIVSSTLVVPMNEWSHLAFAFDDTTDEYSFWVNGVRETVVKAAVVGSSTLTIDNYVGTYYNTTAGYSELWKGHMQQLAYYNKVLTNADITERYNAGTAVNVNHPAAVATATATVAPATISAIDNVTVGTSAATASAVMPAATATGGADRTYSAGAMTATATSPDATYRVTEVKNVLVAEDSYTRSDAPNENNANAASLFVEGISTSTQWRRAWFEAVPDAAGAEKVSLFVYVGGTPQTVNIISIDAAWSEATITHNNAPANGAVTKTFALGGAFNEIPVEEYAGRNGIAITATSASQTLLSSSENATVANRPYYQLTYDRTVIPHVSITAPALTASGAMPVATIETVDNVSFGAVPATASAAMPAATIAPESSVSYAAGVATADATMPDVTMPDYHFTAPVLSASATAPDGRAQIDRIYDATAMTASGAAPNATFSNQTDKTVYAGRLTASARMVGVYIKEADPYLNRLKDTALGFGIESYGYNSQKALIDLTNITGDLLTKTDDGGTIGYVIGDPTVTIGAPGNREALHLDADDSIDIHSYERTLNETVRDVPLRKKKYVEISFKTSKSTGTIIRDRGWEGADLSGAFGTSSTKITHRLNLVDGYLTYQRFTYTYATGITEIATLGRSRNIVSDGEWHHAAIRHGVTGLTNTADGGAGYGISEVYVDGKLSFRFLMGEEAGTRVSEIGGGGFDGEVMWLYVGSSLGTASYHNIDSPIRHEIQRQWYAFLGYIPTAGDPMRATADLVQPERVRGNETRVLCLYNEFYNDPQLDYSFKASGAINIWQGPKGRDGFDYAWSGMLGGEFGYKHPYNEVSGLRRTTYPDVNRGYDWGDIKIFFRNINGKDVGNGFIDPYTREYRLIDLDTDINVSDYDIIFFADYEVGRIPGAGDPNGWGAEVIRKALDLGLNVWCPQPQLALDLGVVDNVAAHSWMRDRNYAGGNSTWWNYDYIAPKMPGALDPGVGGGVRPEDNPNQWIDTHFIMNYRITGTLEGFSEPKGYVLDDMGFFWRTSNIFRSHSQFIRMKFRFLENGLAVGEEHQMNVNIMGDDIFGRVGTRDRATQRKHIIGIPPGTNIAGTVIAREQAKLWHGDSYIENPYQDWALTVAVQPGDILRGKPVNGKIFVDFMGGDPGSARMVRQTGSQTPGQHLYFGGYDFDGRRQPERFTTYTTEVARSVFGGDVEKRVTTEYTVTIPVVGDAPEAIALPNISWVGRAFNWLKIRDEVDPGGTRVRVAAMTASANAPESSVRVEKSVTVGATPLRAQARIQKPVGIVEPNVEYTAFPMEAHARLPGYRRSVYPAPMEATAEMPMATIEGEGETIPLYITFFEPEVYIKEGV